MPTSLRTPVVPPRRDVRADTALLPAPNVVSEADRGDGGDGRVRSNACEPTDERQALAPVVHGERAGGENCVE